MTASPAELKLTAIVATLHACQLFRGLPVADVRSVAEFSILQRLSGGQHVFREGEPSQGFYIIQRGTIKIYRVSPAGREQVIHVFRTGDSFAEGTLGAIPSYPADAQAIEPSTVLLIPRDPMLALVGRRPDIALRMLGSMSQHLHDLVGMLDDMQLKDVRTRVLNWLLRQDPHAKGLIRLAGTKKALAAELGTSSETLSRTLGVLRDCKLISIKGRTISLLDRDNLELFLRRSLGER